MSKKNMPPAYADDLGPVMVATHSYRLSPLGPAEQLLGGSVIMSSSSFWILAVKGARGRAGREKQEGGGTEVVFL